jgi:hypothetical protein
MTDTTTAWAATTTGRVFGSTNANATPPADIRWTRLDDKVAAQNDPSRFVSTTCDRWRDGDGVRHPGPADASRTMFMPWRALPTYTPPPTYGGARLLATALLWSRTEGRA